MKYRALMIALALLPVAGCGWCHPWFNCSNWWGCGSCYTPCYNGPTAAVAASPCDCATAYSAPILASPGRIPPAPPTNALPTAPLAKPKPYMPKPK